MSTSPRQASIEHDTTPSAPVTEFGIVRTRRAEQVEGDRIPRHTQGTVVAIYDRGSAYAVEIADLPGGPEVVTLRGDQIERVH
ncbi:MAG TPA: hypothetical protein VND19_03550 [Acetobacteraceae bacterium]|nr:hypothetical protein [Acetobacteraceae bacterium]